MLKGYKYRVYPTQRQKPLFDRHFDCARLIYNLAFEAKQAAYLAAKVNLSKGDLKAELTLLKKEYPWLNDINSQSLQKPLDNLDTVYKKFFKKECGFPRFKKKTGKNTFHCPQNISVHKKHISIPKFREGILMEVDRPVKGEIKSCTFSRTPTGKYFVSILCETGEKIPDKKPVMQETAIGLDLGLKTFVVGTKDFKKDNPRYMDRMLLKLKAEQRRLSKKKKGSNRGKKQRLRVARLHEKIANQREDFLHKVSNEITNRFDTICMEDLKVANMAKNPKLSLKINDAGWGMFKKFVKYKCEWKGKNFIEINTFFPGSKLCSTCMHKNTKLTLSVREWTCDVCGSVHDRDMNAAVNIENEGLRIWRTERACQDEEATHTPLLHKRKGKGSETGRKPEESSKVHDRLCVNS